MNSDGTAPALKILIVEDEALVAEEIQDRLTRLGYDVVGIADTGSEAIALAEETRPDLTLMDIRIKGRMDGIETAKEIFARVGSPIVFTTAHSDQDTLNRAQIAAQFGYVVKRSGSAAHALQMDSYGVRPRKVFRRLAKL